MFIAKDSLINTMLSKGWSLSDLSRESGVSYKTIWFMKTKKPVAAKTAKKVAEALEVEVNDVFRVRA